jgi:hypothetical protein
LRGDIDSRRRLWATAAGVGVGGAAYLLTLLDYSTRLTRTANSLGYASNFFDLQARAFMKGHLYVPQGSLGLEAFERGGHEYMYFPPFPALLRIPVLMTTREYDGRLTLLSMALALVLMAVMTTRLVWLIRGLMVGDRPLGRFEAVAWAIFLALSLGGTAATFNASLPWVYHEVYAWAVPLVVGSMYWMLRVMQAPERRSILWLGLFILCTILTRTTGGWAVCLLTIVIGIWLLTGRLHPSSRRVGWGVVSVGSVALGIGIAYNMVRFAHPFLFPLQDQVWTHLNSHRREALEVNGGTITGPQFFETSLVNYFRIDGIRFVDYFPWITLPAEPAHAYGGAFIDQTYRTGSITSFMPLLFLLTIIAIPVLFRRGVDRSRRMLRVPLVAGVLLTAGVMGYGYLSYRYTCEFVPALILGGAVGLCAIVRFLRGRGRAVKATALAVLTAATGFSIAANMLTGFSAAAMTAGGPQLARYLELQRALEWPGPGPRVTRSDVAPTGGSADDLHIRGDCDALYFNTGDAYETWELVERRSIVVLATLAPNFTATWALLATSATNVTGRVVLRTDNHHRARIVLRNETGNYRGPWFDVAPPGVIRVGVLDRPELGYAEVSSTPGGWVGYLRSSEWDADWIRHPIDLEAHFRNTRHLARHGITLQTGRGLDPPLCEELAADTTAGP